MPELGLSDLGGHPRDEAAFLEVDDVVLPVDALRQGRDERSARLGDALTRSRFAEVVVAVPFRLPCGVGDEREHLSRGGVDDEFGADNLEGRSIASKAEASEWAESVIGFPFGRGPGRGLCRQTTPTW